MNNAITPENYEKAKKEAKEFYSKIGKVWCHQLQDYISFNTIGFGHLVRKGRKFRSVPDQMRRFHLLYFAKNILENPSTTIYRTENREKNDPSLTTIFWALTGKVDHRTITIIICQVGNGKKHFFSIYDQKTAQ